MTGRAFNLETQTARSNQILQQDLLLPISKILWCHCCQNYQLIWFMKISNPWSNHDLKWRVFYPTQRGGGLRAKRLLRFKKYSSQAVHLVQEIFGRMKYVVEWTHGQNRIMWQRRYEGRVSFIALGDDEAGYADWSASLSLCLNYPIGPLYPHQALSLILLMKGYNYELPSKFEDISRIRYYLHYCWVNFQNAFNVYG